MSAMWTLTIKELVKWDLKSYSKMKEIHLKEYPMQSMHPMGDQVLIASEAHAWMYNLLDRQKSTQVVLNDVEDARFSHKCDEQMIISTGYKFDVRVYASNTGFAEHVFEGHKEAIQTVDINYNYTILASGSADGTAKLWDLTKTDNHMLQSLKAHDQGVAGVKFVVFPDRIITTSLNGWIKIWNLEDYEVLQTLKVVNEKFANIRQIQVTPDGSRAFFACWHNRTIYSHRIGTPKSYLICMRYFKLNGLLGKLRNSLFRDLFSFDSEWRKIAGIKATEDVEPIVAVDEED